jgi:hypothetical protein
MEGVPEACASIDVSPHPSFGEVLTATHDFDSISFFSFSLIKPLNSIISSIPLFFARVLR